jgi:hypothetical protein
MSTALTLFTITREDGRSHQQVVVDLIRMHEPGAVLTFEDFATALRTGTDQTFDTERVRNIVRQSQARLLRELQRTLVSLRGVGYRLAHAHEHMGIARSYQRGADAKLRRGLQRLRHVRWDEMEANTREVHRATLMVVEAVYANQQALAQRQSKVEDLLGKLKQQVDGIEGKLS